MTKGLEALKRIKNDMIYQLQIKGECVVNDDFHIIEKELQRLMVYDIQQEQTEKWLENANKKHKAFEIMKNKRVDMFVIHSNSLQDYNNYIKHHRVNGELTQEEYDLLKEVLL